VGVRRRGWRKDVEADGGAAHDDWVCVCGGGASL